MDAAAPFEPALTGQRLRKRSLSIAGHRTSISLEDAFWRQLQTLARDQGLSTSALVARIDRHRDGSLSGALRVYVLHALVERAGD